MTTAIVAALIVLVVGLIPLFVVLRRDPRSAPARTLPPAPRPQAELTPRAIASREAQAARAQAYGDSRTRGDHLVAMGLAAAILLPIGGILIGIALLVKDRIGPGLGVILLSVLAVAVYYALLTG